VWEVVDNATEATLVPLDPPTPWNDGVLLLEKLHVTCPLTPGEAISPSTTLKIGSLYRRYDPRLVMLDNTLDAPVNLSSRVDGFGTTPSFLCPSAPKTFLNEHTCTMVGESCLPYEYTEATSTTDSGFEYTQRFQLNRTVIRMMYETDRKLVYVLENLPLRVPDVAPCRMPTRWRSLGEINGDSSCAAHGGETAFTDSSTRDVIVNAFLAALYSDANPYLRDIDIYAGSRDNRDACELDGDLIYGAKVDWNGECWQHSNPNYGNVWDFTTFANSGEDHPGNEDSMNFRPITQFAFWGLTSATLPQSHHDGRLSDALFSGELFPLLGRLGDWLTFGELPPSVRNPGIAAYLGVGIAVSSVVPSAEVCGSPGEVASRPDEGARFYFTRHRLEDPNSHVSQEVLANHRPQMTVSTMMTVHTMVALFQPDQLRQRVAWALSQILVAAKGPGILSMVSREMWLGFYDIFVRNAFGSYFDVLREVSYSSVMAAYLTYLDNQAWAVSGTAPDENYAREIMQLFSIGLWMLEPDGTQTLDANGNPVPSYTNPDIVSQAKVWTGFTERPIRGNYEIRRNPYNRNQIDPMYIVEAWRDTFPKMNLYKGYVGDSRPLCSDLGRRPFLRAGARYRYLGQNQRVPALSHGLDWTSVSGSTGDNAPYFRSESSSALYALLCDADGASGDCRFKSSVVLSGNLPCHGLECHVDTLRIVLITVGGHDYSFEYLPLPCVSLAFLEGGVGRFVETVKQGEVRDKLCMEPRSAVAAPACCTPQKRNCFEYPCSYIEERMTYSSALERCTAWQDRFASPPPPSPLPPPPPSPFPPPTGIGMSFPSPAPPAQQWMLFPHAYGTGAADCPAGSHVPTEEECVDAAVVALALRAEPHLEAPEHMTLSVFEQSARPRGCIVSLQNGRVYYNTHATGRASNTYKLVCSTDAFPTAANFSTIGGSGNLCSFKLATCQTLPSAGRGCRLNQLSDTLLATYWWTEEPCRVQVQVHIDGRAARVDPGATGVDPKATRLQPNSENWFRVAWAGGAFPQAATGCADSCTVYARVGGDTCLCDISVATTAAFTDTANVPTHAEVEASLRIGAAPPAHFDDGTYAQCATAACSARSAEVVVFTRGTASDPIFDEHAIFQIRINGTIGRTLHLANKVSMIALAHAGADSAYSFRNPPMFMGLIDTAQRDAMYETDDLLNHLFWHQNVGPFLAIRLIQRLVTSNPSPRYVAAATAAFRSGIYEGVTYSGEYGDLGAMVAAILLDREARSLVLTADPTHGHVREPLVKLFHLMRAMEAVRRDDRDLELSAGLISKIGQQVFRNPSVFNFFQPEFSPSGPIEKIGLLAPEAQLGVLPFAIGFMDGMAGLTFDGFSACEGGLFGGSCSDAIPAPWAAHSNHGYLGYTPTDASTAASAIDELDLLLTAGRLDAYTRTVITDEYENALAQSRCPTARTDLCGRLTPETTLYAGEHITNVLGETLCFTYDGVARHIGADGKEVFSTALRTRGVGLEFRYWTDGLVQVRERGDAGDPTSFRIAWTSATYAAGHNASFFSFLEGPCELPDQAMYERKVVHRFNTGGLDVPTMLACSAPSTCSLPAPAPPSAAYAAERARTDATYALQVAQNLFAVSAAFATTNRPATTIMDVPPSPPRVYEDRPYKAMVVFFMRGGADTFNMLIPRSGCDARQLQLQYTATRGAVALTNVNEIDVPSGTQPCTRFGVHEKLPIMQQLYNEGDLAFIANAGVLVEPISKSQYLAGEGELPPQLFAHNTQQNHVETLNPMETFSKGIVGRILNALDEQASASGAAPLKTASYSITSNKYIFRGTPFEPIMLSAAQGMLTYEGSSAAKKAGNTQWRNNTLSAVARLVGREAVSIFAETHNQVIRDALRDSDRIASILEGVRLTVDWTQAVRDAPTTEGGELVQQLEQVSNVIASRRAFETERDFFLVELGGFDTHADLIGTTDNNYDGMNAAFTAFVAELKALGAWEQTTILSVSDFGRTMTNNGRGTDHAWGGNYFIMGGDVSGGKVHGTFPELRTDGPDSISSTGQMLPTTPWEAVWKPIAQWLGVADSELNTVLPNLHRFPSSHLLELSNVYDSR